MTFTEKDDMFVVEKKHVMKYGTHKSSYYAFRFRSLFNDCVGPWNKGTSRDDHFDSLKHARMKAKSQGEQHARNIFAIYEYTQEHERV